MLTLKTIFIREHLEFCQQGMSVNTYGSRISCQFEVIFDSSTNSALNHSIVVRFTEQFAWS